jgi:Glutaredoxin-like domain (DUF836)
VTTGPDGVHGGTGPVITLLTRPGCHLCDDARTVIAAVASELGVAWQERDITLSDADLGAYSDMVPVTLIDGAQHDFWRVSEERLRAALAAARRERDEVPGVDEARQPPGARGRPQEP